MKKDNISCSFETELFTDKGQSEGKKKKCCKKYQKKGFSCKKCPKF